jgi:signal transduction histidine kinase
VASAISLIRPLMRGLAGELNEQQQDILSRIDNRLDMLMELVNDLLALAATRAVAVEEDLESISVQPILRNVIGRLGSEAQAKKIAVNVEMPDGVVTAAGTAKGLDTIFSNLLGNAIKYTPEGGAITIQLTQTGDQTQIVVSDTGIGIPATDLARIGEEFFRAENVRRSAIIGTGLGLSIVIELVQHYGGTIDISSQEGQGTKVTMILPAAESKP